MESTQGTIFEQTAQPIVDAVLQGFNGTVFAYGQTGTGKSYTMDGADGDAEGIIPRAFEYIFHYIANQSGERAYLVRATYCEIHNEEIRDLLSKDPKKRLRLKESLDRGAYVHGLKQIVVNSAQELRKILQSGKRHRAVGATKMNDTSSRSHAIFSLVVECRGAGHTGDTHIRVGKLNLVDLAGSERQSKTETTGARLKEGIQINLSLTALGNVISSLVDPKQTHIPYRDSKLTRLLQDSLGGNTKTVMIANIGPVEWNLEETLSTLRYANRAKNIQNKPVINEDPKDAMLRQYQEEIARLKAELEHKTGSQMQGSNRQAQLREEYAAQIRAELQSEAAAAIRQRAEAEAHERIQCLAEEQTSAPEDHPSASALEEQQRELALTSERLDEERRQREALQSKIREMESKVLHGGVNLLEKMEALDKRNAETKAQLAQQKEQDREQKRRFDALYDVHLLTEEKFSSLEEEAETKSRKLKLVAAKYQAKLEELSDLQWEFERERASWREATAKLTQSLKLKQCLIDSFIPPRYQEKIMQHCRYSAEREEWRIDAVDETGNAIRERRRRDQHLPSEPLEACVYLSYDDVQPVALRPSSRRGRSGIRRRVSAMG